jgi:hypothetical protein
MGGISAYFFCALHYVKKHAFTRYFMQYFWEIGAHSASLTRGQNHYV